MSIIDRFATIMKSNINAMLDKAEDPSKMIDQTLRDLRQDLAKVKTETAAVMANEDKACRDLVQCVSELSRVTTAAENAVKAGNDDDARKLIEKKQQLEQNKVSLEKNAEVAKENATKMRQMHDKLVSDIEQLESRRDVIKAKVATAKAQSTVNKIQAGTDSSKSIEAFNRMEEKADRMLDTANAEAELNASTHKTEDLVNKYSTGGSVSVEEELAAMKAKLGV